MPRSKTVFAATASLLVAVSITPLLPTTYGAHAGLWLLAALAYIVGCTSAIFAWRPMRLLLDEHGFYKIGFTQKLSDKTLWKDVETFKVIALGLRGREQKYVGLCYRAGFRRPVGSSATLNASIGAGVDAYIPMIWPRPVEAIVNELNGYRQSAIAAAG